jgi:hypothetical protein
MHFTTIPDPGAATSCTAVALSTPLLNIASFLEPVVHLPDLIYDIVGPSYLLMIHHDVYVSTLFILLRGRIVWAILIVRQVMPNGTLVRHSS